MTPNARFLLYRAFPTLMVLVVIAGCTGPDGAPITVTPLLLQGLLFLLVGLGIAIAP